MVTVQINIGFIVTRRLAGFLMPKNKGVIYIVVRELLIALGFQLDQSKLKQADAGINKFKASAESAISVLGRMAATIGVVFGVGEIIKMGDAWTNVDSRIGLVTKSTAEQAEMQQKVFDIAQKTRQEYTSTGDLFFKMARNSKQLGASQQDVLDVTETVNKALVIGGASTAEANATILQLSQALASGRLQGDELRSLSENASILMDEVAKYYGVTVGKLKEMGKDGELTAEGVFAAILKAKSKMDAEFERMPITIGQSVTYALNEIGMLIFKINKETGVFQSIAKGIIRATNWITSSIDRGVKVVGGWGKAFKLLTAAIVSFGAALYIVRNGLFTLQMWALWLQILRLGVVNLARSFLAFLLNPAFLTIAAITIGLVLMALALEDLYYWITGGDSVLGDWLGSWEGFKTKVDAWIYNLVSNLQSYWRNLRNSIFQYIDDMINKVMEWANKAKNFFGMVGMASMQADVGGFGVTPASMYPGGGGPVTINVGDTNIEQNIAGTGQQLANDVGVATGDAASDSNSKLARDIENIAFAW
jgi:tape measure domain-containing protein